MPDVVELLELLHGNTPRWQNLRAVVVHRVDPAAREAPPRKTEQERSGGTPVDLRPVDRRWLEARYELTAAVDPLRLRMTRLDYAGNDPQGVPPESAVDDGQVLWEQVALRVNRARHRRPHNRHVRAAEWLLMPRDLAVCHQLSITGTQTRDGRATWKVHAEPLPADLRPLVLPTPRHGLRGELKIDAELGVVVAADWTLDERLVEATTLLDLHADESAAAQTFRFEPPSGANLSEGTLSPIPTRFKPAFAVGILTAVISEHIARLLSRLPSRSKT